FSSNRSLILQASTVAASPAPTVFATAIIASTIIRPYRIQPAKPTVRATKVLRERSAVEAPGKCLTNLGDVRKRSQRGRGCAEPPYQYIPRCHSDFSLVHVLSLGPRRCLARLTSL